MKEEKAQKKIQKEFYLNLANKFDKEQKRENRNHINKIKAISNYLKIKNNEKVLEVGIGTGIHAKHLFELNKPIDFKLYGVDLSESMLIEAKKKLKNYNTELKVMDGENLEFDDNAFDKVYISGSLHHYFNPQKGISEVLRVLKKGGKFCMMEPNYYFPHNFIAAHKIECERNIKLMKIKNFKYWLSKENVKYNIKNFAYTPPFPNSLIPFYNILDKIINQIPLLNRFSIMLFAYGKK